MAKIDVSKLSAEDLEDLKAQIKRLDSRRSDPDYRAKCRDVREKCKKLCIKEGVTLVDIFTIPNEDRLYTDSKTGATWWNWQRGKKPAWVKEQMKKDGITEATETEATQEAVLEEAA